MTYVPKPGDIFVRRMGGPAGPAIRFGQWLNGDGFRDFEHAGVVTAVENAHDDEYVDILVVEAMPGGAVEAWHRGVHLSDVGGYGWAFLPAPVGLAANVVACARKYKGVGYSALDYDALALHRFHIPAPGLKHYIDDTGHMICSQLADRAAADAGWHLFADNRWPGYVTPGDISGLIFHERTAA